jgi:hypothetical protein
VLEPYHCRELNPQVPKLNVLLDDGDINTD